MLSNAFIQAISCSRINLGLRLPIIRVTLDESHRDGSKIN